MITNYHAFLLKDAKEIKGVAKNTRLLLKGDRADDPFKETPKAMVSRVLRDLGCGQAADHGAQRRGASLLPRSAAIQTGEKVAKEQAEANEKAGVWFTGLQADRQARRDQADLGPLRDAVLPVRLAVTTRATSSRGPSATSR